MNRITASGESQIQEWAKRQLADYDARRPGAMFAEGLVLNLAEAYQLQAAVAQLRRDRGERVLGYKVGCTSPTIRAQLGIEHCVYGRLYDSEQHASGAELSRGQFEQLAIEGELAVELSRAPNEEDFLFEPHDRVRIPACVARVFPVVELHNHVMRGQRPSAGELIANNAIHAGFVAGSGLDTTAIDREEPIDSAGLSIFADGRLLDECTGAALIPTIVSSLKWLTEELAARSEQLSSGQIVLTGSIPSLIPIADDCAVRVEAAPFGGVNVQFTP